MAARLAPVLGLATASVLLTAVGVAAMSFADQPAGPVSFAGAVLSAPSALAAPSRAASTPAAVPPNTPKASPSRAATSPPASSGAHSAPTRSQPSATAPPSSADRSRKAAGQAPTAPQPNLAMTSADSYARAVFEAVNQARTQAHLPALQWSSRLQLSARRHNQAMAAANTLAHQVGDEDSLGQRETKAGVQWSFAAENIGWTTSRSRSGALGIEASMLAESAPNDAHRRNILSKDVHALGVDVLIDASHGRLWLTEDFADVG